MKIGKYNRLVVEFVKHRQMKVQDLKIILLLNETMWMNTDDVVYFTHLARHKVTTALKLMKDRGYIKIARRENWSRGLKRMYCITQKGRYIATQFINQLNQES